MADVIVIGGGASGLTAAIFAARNKNRVLVLEHKDKTGKKILATGNGKCNFTNKNQGLEYYRGSNAEFIQAVLRGFTLEKTLDFFKELGIHPKDKKGYIYPNSEQALAVAEVLNLELKTLLVPVYCDSHVDKIELGHNRFIVSSNNKQYSADKAIIATGGCASANLGSDGSGFILAKELGHNIIKPLPALVQLKSPEKYFKTLAGVRTDALVSLYIQDKLKTKEKGEILFAAYGVSGIPILQISRFASKALDEKKKVFLTIDFFPENNLTDMSQMLFERFIKNPKRKAEEVFIGLLNNKLAYVCLKEAGVNPLEAAEKVSKHNIEVLCRQLKEWRVPIDATNSFEQAQVTAGGVDTREINPVTLESRLRKGLYFAGEVIDVDGTCGGYNLQWAWTTGAIAGKSI